MDYAYHYTGGYGLVCILRDRCIRPYSGAIGESPIAWFTLSEEWDPTTSPPAEGTLGLNWGRFRIVTLQKYVPLTMESLRKKYPATAEQLIQLGIKNGADPTQWRIRYTPLRCRQWVRVEGDLGDGSWKPLSWERLDYHFKARQGRS